MFRKFWKARGVWLRILFCWSIGMGLPFFDEAKDYDLRFRMRGSQDIAWPIVEVFFDKEDWMTVNGQNPTWLRARKEPTEITDSYFWHGKTWDRLLGTILSQDPKVVGVTLFFNDQLPKPDENMTALVDPRVIWAARLDHERRPILPLMTSSSGFNVGLIDLREDPDRILRRFTAPLSPIPHMGLKLAESQIGSSVADLNGLLGEAKLINFRGARQVYPAVSATAVLRNRIPPAFFKDKIVVIGSHSVNSQQFQTPLGTMGRADVMAQIVDNVLGRRWIARISPWLWALYSLLIVILTVSLMATYPQAVAFVFLLWLGLGTSSLSLWVFDTFDFWIPAVSPLALILVTYMVSLGYQLSLKENQTWRLEQEKALLSELDQLRNNFVSLISHDLKTPIAKIQAICDRLLAGAVAGDVKDGLLNLRKESVELHRYIQSILQISRLESNKVQIRTEAIDINELVENVVAQLHSLVDDKRQTLSQKLEPMFSIEADSVMLREVILNLIENAVKYTPNDGQIQVQTQEVDDKVIFAVKDSGPGIPKEDQEHLFEKFFRGQAQKGQIKGTGLGLFLVKYFVELHGGEVFLESEVGKGTRVGFTLPLQA